MTSPEAHTAEILRRMEEEFPDQQTRFRPSMDSSVEEAVLWGRQHFGHGRSVDAVWLAPLPDRRSETATEERDTAVWVGPGIGEEPWGEFEGSWPESSGELGVGDQPRVYELARALARRSTLRFAAERALAGRLEAGLTKTEPLEDLLSQMRSTQTVEGELDDRTGDRLRLDLEYVWRRLSYLFSDRQGKIWLESNNLVLDGRPLDAIRNGNIADVIYAIDVEEQGAFG